MAFANHLDEGIHIGIDEIAEVVELIGTRRMAPVQHVNVTPRLGEVPDERAIVLEVEDVPMPDHRVRHQYRRAYARRMIRSDPVERAAGELMDLFARRRGNL